MSDNPLPADSAAKETIISVENLFLALKNDLSYGPLNFTLRAGEGAIVTCQNLELLRGVMHCCLGQDRPHRGQVHWWPGSEKPDVGWASYNLYRYIGYVDRHSQLLSNMSLIDNIMLLFRYAMMEIEDAEVMARRILDGLGLQSYERARSDYLPEPKRRLALYALALCRRPRLLLMERPNQFLDHDFHQVWDLVLRGASQGMGYIVFDRTRTIYDKNDFQVIQKFNPGSM